MEASHGQNLSPSVSVGLPVRNGMPYIEEALRALEDQDLPGFELVIGDNGSTDGTSEICERVARRRPRTEHHRYSQDAGASENFNRTMALTTGEYFTWAAHDDRFLPQYLSRCLAALQRRPDCVMAVPDVWLIDGGGVRYRLIEERDGLGSPDLATRLRSYLWRTEWLTIYGVIRRAALTQTRLLDPIYGSDVALVFELLLQGPAVVVHEPLFEYRKFPSKTIADVLRGQTAGTARSTARAANLKLWRHLWRSTSVPPEPSTRRTARRVLVRWSISDCFRDLLFADLLTELEIARGSRLPVRRLLIGGAMVAIRPRRALAKRQLWASRSTELAHHREGDCERGHIDGDAEGQGQG